MIFYSKKTSLQERLLRILTSNFVKSSATLSLKWCLRLTKNENLDFIKKYLRRSVHWTSKKEKLSESCILKIWILRR